MAVPSQNRKFMRSLFHDLKNPLTPISLHADLLLENPSPKEIEAASQGIRDAVEQIQALIERAERVSTLSAGAEIQLKPELCDINKIALEVIDEIERPFTGSMEVLKPQFLFNLVHGSVQGSWPPKELKSCIFELVDNALQYGSPDSPVTITTIKTDAMVIFSVHNEGPEIGTDDQERIFELFESGTKSVPTKKGWGFGLTWVREITKLLGGSVHMQSSATAGTSVCVQLPLGATDTQEPS